MKSVLHCTTNTLSSLHSLQVTEKQKIATLIPHRCMHIQEITFLSSTSGILPICKFLMAFPFSNGAFLVIFPNDGGGREAWGPPESSALKACSSGEACGLIGVDLLQVDADQNSCCAGSAMEEVLS